MIRHLGPGIGKETRHWHTKSCDATPTKLALEFQIFGCFCYSQGAARTAGGTAGAQAGGTVSGAGGCTA